MIHFKKNLTRFQGNRPDNLKNYKTHGIKKGLEKLLCK
jgi:hypothetical protein